MKIIDLLLGWLLKPELQLTVLDRIIAIIEFSIIFIIIFAIIGKKCNK